MESDRIEKFYKEIIHLCDIRITQLTRNSRLGLLPEDPEEESFNLSFDFNSSDFSAGQLVLVKTQLNQCRDKDLLSALRDEFQRQLKNHENKKLGQNQPPPPPFARTPSSEHRYFLAEIEIDGSEDKARRYCHFDGQRIARELIIQHGKRPLLLLTGRDDADMCEWNLDEALIAEDLGDEITENEFNSGWFDQGGFPYVRTARKVRRFLTSALIKKI